MPKFIQVNLTSETDADIKEVAKYTLLDPDTKQNYIDNLIIYEFNLPKIKVRNIILSYYWMLIKKN